MKKSVSLLAKLSLSYLAVALFLIACVSFFSNFFLTKQFEAYVMRQQEAENAELASQTAARIENDRRRDDRPRKGTAARLVHTRDQVFERVLPAALAKKFQRHLARAHRPAIVPRDCSSSVIASAARVLASRRSVS